MPSTFGLFVAQRGTDLRFSWAQLIGDDYFFRARAAALSETMAPVDQTTFLASCDIIDWQAESVRGLAARLTAKATGLEAVRILFDWVRDEVAHTGARATASSRCARRRS